MDPSVQAHSISSSFMRLTISSSYTDTDQEGKFTMYVVCAQSTFAKWEVCRRYRHFANLHQELTVKFPHIKLPALPGKKILGSSLQASFVEDRRLYLEAYIRQLVNIPEVWTSQKFVEFLDHSQAFLGVHMKMTEFTERISTLETIVSDLHHKLSISFRMFQESQVQVQQMAARMQQLETAAGNPHAGDSCVKPSWSGVDQMFADTQSRGNTPRSIPIAVTSPVGPSAEGFGSGRNNYASLAHLAEPTISSSFDISSDPVFPGNDHGTLGGLDSAIAIQPPSSQLQDQWAAERGRRASSTSEYRSPGGNIMSSDAFISYSNIPSVSFAVGNLSTAAASPPSPGYFVKHLLHIDQHQSFGESSSSRRTSVDDGASNSSMASLLPFRADLQHGAGGGAGGGGGGGHTHSSDLDSERESLFGQFDSERSLSSSGLLAGVSGVAVGVGGGVGVESEGALFESHVRGSSAVGPGSSVSLGAGSAVSGNPGGGGGANLWSSVARSLGMPENSFNPLMSSLGEHYGRAEATIWDRLVDEVVSLVQPQDSQLSYRGSVITFISKLVRKTLGVHVFEIDMQGLRCFLPDDPVRLSIFVGKADKEATWYVKLNEKLCRLSGGIQDEAEVGRGQFDDGANDAVTDLSDFNMYSSKSSWEQTNAQSPAHNWKAHSLTNVSFTNDYDGSHKLQCLVDNMLGVEIVSNFRVDLCLLMFFEEFDRLVGKNHLLKRSLLLIRAWWVYEANLSFNVLSENALCVMVCALFNRHHTGIYHPFQALYSFLAEYSSISFSSNVLTIYGPVPYDVYSDSDCAATALPSCPPPTCSPLLTPELIARYRGFTQASDSSGSSSPLADGSGESSISADVSSLLAPNPINRSCFPSKAIMIAHPFLGVKSNMVSNEPTVGGGLSITAAAATLKRKVAKISEGLQSGALALHTALKDEIRCREGSSSASASAAASHSSQFPAAGSSFSSVSFSPAPVSSLDTAGLNHFNYHSHVENLFKVTTARFGRGWRPDAPEVDPASHSGHTTDELDLHLLSSDSSVFDPSAYPSRASSSVMSPSVIGRSSLDGGASAARGSCSSSGGIFHIQEEPRDTLSLSLEKLLDRVRYTNLLLEAQISESALRTLSLEILAEKGSLPVGEIGKMLQEATAMSSMSVALKERFGGLKKFLERYPDDFVLSNDHPFNPHVYLRKPLNLEDVALVMRGEVPSSVKAACPARNKKKQASLNNGRGGGGGGGGVGAMLSPGSSGIGSGLNAAQNMYAPNMPAMHAPQAAANRRKQSQTPPSRPSPSPEPMYTAAYAGGGQQPIGASKAYSSAVNRSLSSSSAINDGGMSQPFSQGRRYASMNALPVEDSHGGGLGVGGGLASTHYPYSNSNAASNTAAAARRSLSSSAATASASSPVFGRPDPRAPAFIPGSRFLNI